MVIDTSTALDALDEAIKWKLRPALDPDRIFDEIAFKLHRHPMFRHLKVVDCALGAVHEVA
jgi:hypothetical protein